MHLVNVLAQVRRGRQAAGPYVAYRLVHCLAIRSCSALLVMYCVAMLPTRGSAGKEAESGVSKYQRLFHFRSQGRGGMSGRLGSVGWGWDVAVFVVGVSGEEVRSCFNLEKRRFNNDLQMTCS